MSGALIAIGIILSFYGNQVIFEDLAKTEGDIGAGEELILETELDASINENGVYAVQILNFKEDIISINLYDPLGMEIKSQKINKEVEEGKFDIIDSGTYKLIIRNTDQEKMRVLGVIGPEPDAGKKSLGFISLYVLVVGLAGMMGVGIYAVKNRRH